MKIRLTESQLRYILSESVRRIVEGKYDASDTYIWKIRTGGWNSGHKPDADAIEKHRLNLMGEDALECWLKSKDPEGHGFYGLEDIPDDEMWEILVDPNNDYLAEEPIAESKTKYLKDNKGKYWKTDKNEKVPEKCPKCGAAMHLKVQGEPVFICDHGHYFGTLKFSEE